MEYAQNGEFFDYIMDGRVYLSPHSVATNAKPTITSLKSYQVWSTCIGCVSRIAILSLKICCWMYTTGLRLSILGWVICIRSRRSWSLLVGRLATPRPRWSRGNCMILSWLMFGLWGLCCLRWLWQNCPFRMTIPLCCIARSRADFISLTRRSHPNTKIS